MSSYEGRSASFVDRMGNVTVEVSDLSSNKDAYKLDTECTLCKTAAWTIFYPKKYCKFCYRCVCKDCSLHRVYHPERLRQERCCNFCYDRFISQGVMNSMQYQLGVTNNMVRQASELLEEEKDRRSIQDATQTGLRAAIKQVQEELQGLRRAGQNAISQQDQALSQLETDITALKSDLQNKQNRLEETQTLLDNAKKKLDEVNAVALNEKEKVDALKEKLTHTQDEFARMRRMQEDRKMGTAFDSQKTKPVKKGVTELQAVAEELKTQLAALRTQNQELERQVKESDDSERELNKPTELTSNPLLSQYLQLQAEAERLRREKETAPSPQLLETEADTLRRTLARLQEENEDIKQQMQTYNRHVAERRHKKCTIW